MSTQSCSDLLDRLHPRIADGPPRDSRYGVVVNAGGLGDVSPNALVLAGLQRGDDLSEVHAEIVMHECLSVKAFLRKANPHNVTVPKVKAEPKTQFAKNLVHLIGDESVNAWAKRHGLDQTTVQRWVNETTDPRLSNVVDLAEKLQLRPAQLLAENLTALYLDEESLLVGLMHMRMSPLERRRHRRMMDAATDTPIESRGMSDFVDLELPASGPPDEE